MSTTETLTIHLPVSAARRLRRVAEIARRPVDEVLAETLYAILPPLLEDVPAAFQADLARLETLPSERSTNRCGLACVRKTLHAMKPYRPSGRSDDYLRRNNRSGRACAWKPMA